MKKKGMRNVGMALFITAGLSACNSSASTTAENKDSLAQDNTSTATGQMAGDSTTAQSDDAKLVSELVESMYGGIALMKQGEQKATAKPVKDLAMKLDKAHTALTNDMKALAVKKGWSLPAGESSDDMKKREDMGKEDVADYQKDWLKALKDRHETNIKKLEDSKTTDPDLKAAAAKGLPKLHELLSSIEVVQKDMK